MILSPLSFSKSAGDDIESVAASHRELKGEELREINKNYAALRKQAAREEHVYQQQLDGTLFHAFNSCLKCYHQGLADSMDIRAREWPYRSWKVRQRLQCLSYVVQGKRAFPTRVIVQE